MAGRRLHAARERARRHREFARQRRDAGRSRQCGLYAPLCQPALPLEDPGGIEIGPAQAAAVRRRLERDELTVIAYRFDGDRFCTAQRFAACAQALGERFVARVLPDSAANRATLAPFEDVVGALLARPLREEIG